MRNFLVWLRNFRFSQPELQEFMRMVYHLTDQNQIGMELPNIRTWIIFYLISFVGLLWATFLSVQGVMLWVSLFLVIVIVGINFFALYNQLKLRDSRKEMLRNLVQGFERGQTEEESKKTR